MFTKIGIGLAVLGVVSLGVGLRFIHPRSRHRGVTDEEVHRPLPGDDQIPNPAVTATRAVTIDAPPEQVWASLVQMGSRSAGWDAFKRFDHDNIPSAEEIIPAWQQLDVGQVIGKEGFTVQAIDPHRLLLLTSHAPKTERVVKPGIWPTFSDCSQVFVLEPIGEGHTRLITRVRYAFSPGVPRLWRPLIKGAHILLQSRMLRGIQYRVEESRSAGQRKSMKSSKAVIWLSSLIVVLALVAAGIGLFWQDGGHSLPFTTLRGQIVQIYGQGLYHYDTPLLALGNRAADAVTLVVGIPLLVVSMLLYRRGSLRGGLGLSGALAYFLYYYGSMAFGTAYNPLFLVYVALFSASLFAFVLSLTSFNIAALPGHFSTRLPRRGIAIFMFAAALSLLVVWIGLSIVPALLQGKAPPEVASYTTAITDVVDLGVIVPALILTGVLLLRRVPLGYLLASTILVFYAALGANLITAGIVQLLAGVISIGQFIGFAVPFGILTLFDIWLTVVLFRNFSELATWQSTTVREAHA